MCLLYHNLSDKKTLPAQQREFVRILLSKMLLSNLNLCRLIKVWNINPSLSLYLLSCPFSTIQSVREGKRIALQGQDDKDYYKSITIDEPTRQWKMTIMDRLNIIELMLSMVARTLDGK